MGETRLEIPIGPQLLLVPSSSSQKQEVSLTDLVRVLARRKKVFWGVLLGVLIGSLTKAFLTEEQRIVRAVVEIGSYLVEGQPEKFEMPETALAKVIENFIPRAHQDVINEEPEYRGRIQLTARIPKDSGLITIEGQGSKEMTVVYSDLIDHIVEMLSDEHKPISVRVQADVAVEIERERGLVDSLTRKNELLAAQLKRLEQQNKLIASQIEELRERISEARARYASAANDVQSASDSMTLLLIDNEIQRDMYVMRDMENRLLIDQQYERDKLRKEAADVEGHIREKHLSVLALEDKLESIRLTRSVLPPMRLEQVVGPSRLLIIALGGVLGLLAGLIAAFLAELLSNVTTDASEREPRPG